MNTIGLVIGVLFSAVISGVLIWVAGKLGLGLEVVGLGPAFIGGFAIALVGGVITWLLSVRDIRISSGLLRCIVNALVGAVVLLISARFLPGLTVNGFIGALVAAVAIGVIVLLLSLPLRRINQKAALEQEAKHAEPVS
jgi:putative membrane protein